MCRNKLRKCASLIWGNCNILLESLKVYLNIWKDTPFSWMGWLAKFICEFNTILIKISVNFCGCCWARQIVSKYHLEKQTCVNTQESSKKKKKEKEKPWGRLISSDIKRWYEASIIKVMWYWYMGNQSSEIT